MKNFSLKLKLKFELIVSICIGFYMRIQKLSLYLGMVEFETKCKFEFETENKIFRQVACNQPAY